MEENNAYNNEYITEDDTEYVMDMEGKNGIAETERLKRQGLLITKALHHVLLPDGFAPQRGRVVDLACGACEWGLQVADVLGDGVEVIGVDINMSSLEYGNKLASMKRKTNVEFRRMNILQPLRFDDESCDLVHARFAVGILPIAYWKTLIAECYRILKPGGILRMIEPGPNIIDASPTQHELNALVLRSLYKAGKTFSPYEYGVLSAINRLIAQSHFAKPELSSFILDYSIWAPLYEPLTEDFILSVKMMKPFLLKYGDVTEQEFDHLLVGSIEEMRYPEYSALWNIGIVQTQKLIK